MSILVGVSRAVVNTSLLLAGVYHYQRCTTVHMCCQHPLKLLHCRSKADADDVAADLSVPVERLVYRLV